MGLLSILITRGAAPSATVKTALTPAPALTLSLDAPASSPTGSPEDPAPAPWHLPCTETLAQESKKNMEQRLIAETCDRVRSDGLTALRAHRVSKRQARLIEPEVLAPEQAELHDLNQIVLAAVEDALPLCLALGVRMVLQQDPRLPVVPMLLRPIEDALDSAIDLCLDGERGVVRVFTQALPDRAVTVVERSCGSAQDERRGGGGARRRAAPGEGHFAESWIEVGTLGQVELLVGERTARALGGRLRVERRRDDLRFRLELPRSDHEQHARVVNPRGEDRPRDRRRGLRFPGLCAPVQQQVFVVGLPWSGEDWSDRARAD